MYFGVIKKFLFIFVLIQKRNKKIKASPVLHSFATRIHLQPVFAIGREDFAQIGREGFALSETLYLVCHKFLNK